MAIEKILLLVVFLVVKDAAVVISLKEVLDTGDTSLIEDIRFAGAADGKTFFAVQIDGSSALNWFESGQACTGMNMKLAEITSKAQSDAIRLFANSSQIWNIQYWIAGRDAWDHRQFKWESSNEEISEVIGDCYPNIPLPLSCTYFYPCTECSRARIFVNACTNTLRHRLCEVPTSSKSVWSQYVA